MSMQLRRCCRIDGAEWRMVHWLLLMLLHVLDGYAEHLEIEELKFKFQ